jgi:phage recombination protein Bet
MSEEKKTLRLPQGGPGRSAVATREKVGVTVPGRDYTPQEVEIVKRTVMEGCPNASDFEVAQFLTICATVKLDPFARQIYAIRRKGKLVPQTSIDGYVTLAQRTGRYKGRSLPEWTPEPGSAQRPDRCVVWVYDTRGGKAPGLALWAEHKPDQNDFMWRSRPFEQLEKCAFAKALRALFGADAFGGVYVEDEVQGMEMDEADVSHGTRPTSEQPAPAAEPEVQQVQARVIDVEPEQSQPDQDQIDDGAVRSDEWRQALSDVDDPALLTKWQRQISEEVEAGRFDLDQIDGLRAALKAAQERLKGQA